jgi:EpsI family protein
MNTMRRFILLMVLMFTASALAMVLHPTHRIADDGQKVDLEAMIPKQFGQWHEAQQGGQIINPQSKELIERIYSQTISRAYLNETGDVVMLTIAYGADESDDKQLHYPEICYPAQGFNVIANQLGVVKTDFGDIRVKRLLTVKGNRSEPLTYWTTVGNRVVVGSKETKLEQLRYGFHGQIPDGLLFRVSSIIKDTDAGFVTQQSFIRDLVASLSTHDRLKLAGLAESVTRQ